MATHSSILAWRIPWAEEPAACVVQRDLVRPWSTCFLSVDRPWTCCGFVSRPVQILNFTKCCKDSGVLMVVKCRKENSALKDCLTSYYKDPAFYEECKMEYLKEREEFRRTGIPTKKRLQKLPTSM
ncbi:hypothetical protein FD755_010604 [Muntiacus reevesi]|uniref:COX assembly mitochondrial protein n=1 Tax=Muntiacus reevesi TaxID=9886 RepID=A0A5N3Y278_MUNRE|nr:hypothetical protein FD755_010604 [Muntiacus reevesi]